MAMTREQALLEYVLRLGDNVLILGQRLTELIAHGPELEEELANANFALDYLGQARMYYVYAGQLEGAGRDEDDFAFLRADHEYRNLLLVEQPNGHFGDAMVRQFLFESYYVLQLDALARCDDEHLAAIAARALTEVSYHLRHVSQWIVRLGDGTEESHRRVAESLERLWRYTGEAFASDEVDEIVRDALHGPDPEAIHQAWRKNVNNVLQEATLTMPEDGWMAGGGRQGHHTEHFGYLLADMQYLQRAHPGAEW